MVQGTASSVGKSILVTALCRILRQDGYNVAPFKAQNMALNSFVTKEGGEIGRAQAVQAEAAGIEPSVHMNPILLKPQADATSQVVVLGKVNGVSDAVHYYRHNLNLLKVIEASLQKLRNEYEVVVIEGAGSPAEINLMDKEIANMRIAKIAGAPVLLVGDIDRGGVFASIVGTMQLLPINARNLIKGFVINKFRGDVTLLKPALEFLEKRYARPVLGVIPYIRDIKIAQEDSVYLDERLETNHPGRMDIAIIRLPHISNYDDFDPLAEYCNVRYVKNTGELGTPDLIVLPGTKSTIPDLEHLRRTGLAREIAGQSREGVPVIGICGGFQMLGRRIYDPHGVESEMVEAEGLGLLDMEIVFQRRKTTRQIFATVTAGTGLLQGMNGISVRGYEIHMGKSKGVNETASFHIFSSQNGSCSYNDGAIDKRGAVFGTHIHGLFHNYDFTRRLLKNLGNLRNVPYSEGSPLVKDAIYDRLAEIVRTSLDMKKVYEIVFGGVHGRKEFQRAG